VSVIDGCGRAYRARRRSDFLLLGASTTVCVLVMLWTVVMQPWTMPRFSRITCTETLRYGREVVQRPYGILLDGGAECILVLRILLQCRSESGMKRVGLRWPLIFTLVTGARQLVVHEAAVTMWSTIGSYFS